MKFLSRYTDLPSLFHILQEKKLTLLAPSNWEDKNDTEFLLNYKKAYELKSILALCLTSAPETYHHWKSFASSPSGVRINFKYQELHNCVQKFPNAQMKEVSYISLNKKENFPLQKKDLPFIKRLPYRHEQEIRLLWESKNEERECISIPVDLLAIEKIMLSPWLPSALHAPVIKAIKSIDGCQNLTVNPSNILRTESWLVHGQSALNPSS